MKKIKDLKKEISKNCGGVLKCLPKECKVYLVGGGIRDLLNSSEPNDYDFLVDAKIDELIEIFSKVKGCELSTDRQNRSLTVTFKGKKIDFTFLKRQENQTLEEALEENAGKRDLTINAMMFDIKEGKIYDFFKGRKDLENKKIKTIKMPSSSFSEDPKRALRAIRLALKLGFSLDSEAKKAILSLDKSLFFQVSLGKLHEEFENIKNIAGKNEFQFIMKEYGLSSHVKRVNDIFIKEEEKKEIIILQKIDKKEKTDNKKDKYKTHQNLFLLNQNIKFEGKENFNNEQIISAVL